MLKPSSKAKPKATRRHRPWRWSLLAASLALALPLCAQDGNELPDLGDSSARMLSPEREREYSDGLLRQLRNYDLSIEDAELVEYLETLAFRLVQSSGRSETHFHFELIDVPVVNAFASMSGPTGPLRTVSASLSLGSWLRGRGLRTSQVFTCSRLLLQRTNCRRALRTDSIFALEISLEPISALRLILLNHGD